MGFESLEELKMEDGGEEEKLKILGENREKIMSKKMCSSFLFREFYKTNFFKKQILTFTKFVVMKFTLMVNLWPLEIMCLMIIKLSYILNP